MITFLLMHLTRYLNIWQEMNMNTIHRISSIYPVENIIYIYYKNIYIIKISNGKHLIFVSFSILRVFFFLTLRIIRSM